MANPSSTSSSEPVTGRGLAAGWRRWPWAAIAAVFLLLSIEGWGLGRQGPWSTIESAVRGSASVYAGVANDQLMFQLARRDLSARPKVFVVGSSRARRGFVTELAARELPNASVVRFAHPELDPFVMRSMAPELIDADAAVVVLYLSELDTHRSLRLDPIPTKGVKSPLAFFELAADGGLGFAWREREVFYRIVASSLLDTYRFRDLLGQTWLGKFREFPLDSHLALLPTRDIRARVSLGEAVFPADSDLPQRIRFMRALPDHMTDQYVMIAWPLEIQTGEHARILMNIVERTVERFVTAGVEVLIVETPIHRAGVTVRGAGTREEFVALSQRLSRRDTVRFIPLEDQSSYGDDFLDILHLNRAGATRLTERVIEELDLMLAN